MKTPRDEFSCELLEFVFRHIAVGFEHAGDGVFIGIHAEDGWMHIKNRSNTLKHVRRHFFAFGIEQRDFGWR